MTYAAPLGSAVHTTGDPPLTTDLTRPPIAVALNGMRKRFGRFAALDGVDLTIAPGELLALLGPSGSGKTTLLRLIAGLDFPDSGQVRFGEVDVTSAHAAQRGVGFVFQQYALFRHMTVAKNIAFGMDVKPRLERPTRAERQARVLAVSPQILLLDEPFGALDAAVRKSLRRELRRIHDATGVTTVFVTHDQEEALDLADRIAILNCGRIEQLGVPQAVLDAPASAFVAGFVAQANRIPGAVRGGRFEALGAGLPALGVADGSALAFVRPHQLAPAPSLQPGVKARLQRVTRRCALLWLECVAAEGLILEAAVAQDDGVQTLVPGATIRLAFTGGHVFPDAG